MFERNENDYLSDILEASRRILHYTENMEYETVLDDLKTQDSVIRNIEIIGEAVKNLSAEFRLKHNQISWKNIAGMRNRLIHEYFGVNIDIVWGVTMEDIPKLIQEIQKIIS